MKETEIAIKAVKEAGKILMENFEQVHQVREKSLGEIVTESDVAAEQVILNLLKREFPDDAVLSEEAGMSGSGDRMWIVDPLDGTTNYSIRNPFFAVSIGFAKKIEETWRVFSGAVLAPVTGELFFAEKGEGAFLDGEQIEVNKEEKLEKLLLTFCNGKKEEHIRRTVQMFSVFKPVARGFDRLRAGALELAFVASGRTGAYISPGGKSWDAAAGSLLVQEAGGMVSDFQGKDWNVGKEEQDIIATNGTVHEKLLEMMKDIK